MRFQPGLEQAQLGQQNVMIIIAPGVARNLAAAGIVPKRRLGLGRSVMHPTNDDRARSENGHGGIGSPSGVFGEIRHFAGIARLKPVMELGCVWRCCGFRNAHKVKAEPLRLGFEIGGELSNILYVLHYVAYCTKRPACWQDATCRRLLTC